MMHGENKQGCVMYVAMITHGSVGLSTDFPSGAHGPLYATDRWSLGVRGESRGSPVRGPDPPGTPRSQEENSHYTRESTGATHRPSD